MNFIHLPTKYEPEMCIITKILEKQKNGCKLYTDKTHMSYIISFQILLIIQLQWLSQNQNVQPGQKITWQRL